MEAQCWSREFRQLGDATTSSAARPLALLARPAGGSRATRYRLERVIAAAVAAVAFALGWLAHWPPAAPGHDAVATRIMPAVGSPPSSQPTQAAPEARELDSTLADAAVAEPAAATQAIWSAADASDHRQPVTMVGRLRLGTPGSDTDVPIFSGPGIDTEWLNNQPPPVSEYGQAELQRLGYKVDQLRQLVPATLADGRRVAVPVDYVQIRYTGTNPL